MLITDYPEPDLVDNIRHNIELHEDLFREGGADVRGEVWTFGFLLSAFLFFRRSGPTAPYNCTF